jgi:hypothetical protein
MDAAGQLLGINTNRLGEGFYLAIPPMRRCEPNGCARPRESAAPPQLGIAIAPGHGGRLRRAVGLPTPGLLIHG